MAYSRIKVWIAAEILTASDLNAEHTGHITNENDLDTRLVAEIANRTTLESEHDTLQTNLWNSGDGQVADNRVGQASMKDNAIHTAELKPGAVTGDKCAAAIKDPAAGTAGLRTLGTGAAQALPGNADLTPNDSVTFEKIQHGTIMVASYSEEQTDSSAAYVEINPKHTCVYIPADATTIKLKCDLKVTTAYAHETYIKFTVEGTNSSEVATTASGVWQNNKACELDVSAMSGKKTVKVYIKSQHASDAAYHVRNICIYWV